MDLENLIKHFLWSLKCEQFLSENTYKSYFYDFRVFTKAYKEKKWDLEDPTLLQNYYLYLFEDLKNSKSSILRKINLLRKFFVFCEQEKGYTLHSNLSLKVKLDKHYRTFIENEDLLRFRNHLSSLDKNTIRLRMIIEVLYSTGLRVSELLSLKFQDLKEIFKTNSLKIIGKGNVLRVVFFNSLSIEFLKKYAEIVENQSNGPFLLDISRQRVFQLIKELALTLNIELSKAFPHSFRHRLLTNLVKNGVDLISVQKIAGHKQISTTEKYTHVEDYLYEEIHKFHPVIEILKNIKS